MKIVVLSTVGLFILGLSFIGAGSAAVAAPADLLSAQQLAQLRITDPVPVDPAARIAGLSVTPSAAASIAAKRVGRDDLSIGILRGTAPRYVGEADRDVFVVLFGGGEAPFDGPSPGVGPQNMRLTGVLIDAQTGDVLRWFMVS